MPTINLYKRKKKPLPKKEEGTRNDTDARLLRRKAYNNTAWRKLRDSYLIRHPLCERCMENNRVTPATDVHHRKTPFVNGEIDYGRLLDENNLMALCKECHGDLHQRQEKEKSAKELIDALDELFASIEDDENQ